MSEKMVFDSLEPTVIPVKIGTKWYALQEATEEAAAAYQDALFKGTKITLDPDSPNGLAIDTTQFSIEGISGVQSLLVSLCLRECDFDEAKEVIISLGEFVPLSVVKTWPSRVTGPLYERAKLISELDQRGVPTANPIQPGNGHGGMQTGLK